MPSRDFQPNDDAATFERFLGGDDDAFLVLYRKYSQRLFVYCLKILGDRQHAEDATQELWERVINIRGNAATDSGEQGAPSVRNPGGLFLRAARNLCIDKLRAARQAIPLDESAEVESIRTASEPSELESVVVEMLDRLSFEYREVLVLNLYCGYRFDEIAAMTGRTPDAVWARASRARAQLRKMVAAAIGPGNDGTSQGTSRYQARTEDRV